jgi:hypothetical protein
MMNVSMKMPRRILSLVLAFSPAFVFSSFYPLYPLRTFFTTSPLAAASSWSLPRRVSDEAIMSWFPALVADRAGIVHLAYASAMPEDLGLNSYDMIEYVTLDG